MDIEQEIKNILDKLPYIRTLKERVGELTDQVRILEEQVATFKTLYPPGHYYNPVPSKEDILSRRHRIFRTPQKEIGGIALNEIAQLKLLDEIKKYYDEISFKDIKSDGLRYYFNNDFYSYSDAIFLYSIIRHFKPNKIIEIGSGFSSAVMLDTNELFFKSRIKCCFIDPDPERLFSILTETDKRNHEIMSCIVQTVGLNVFRQLKENDILFVDSSHVLKTGSDLNYIVFEILPSLNAGVLIHFHDIHYPFEYPFEWVMEGRAFNETYALRAFLQYNSQFEIALFNTFLEYHHEDWFKKNMPLCLKNRGGSLWLRKS